MSRLRFSIASLLGLVLFLAVGLAALREATDLWDSAAFTGTIGLLLVSVLLAAHRTEHRRAFWLGFAVFGWAAIVASLVPAVEARLPTTKLLAYLDSTVPGRNNVLAVDLVASLPNTQILASTAPQVLEADAFISGAVVALPTGTSENFIRIGHSLIALVLACVGGHLSRSLHVSEARA